MKYSKEQRIEIGKEIYTRMISINEAAKSMILILILQGHTCVNIGMPIICHQ